MHARYANVDDEGNYSSSSSILVKLNEKVHERAGRGGPTRSWNTLVPSLRLTKKNLETVWQDHGSSWFRFYWNLTISY